MSLRLSYAALGSAALLAAGCSSSSDSTTTPGGVEGLTTPSQLSIVTAQEEASLGAGGVAAGAGATNFPAGTDYFTDAANTYVYDPSIEPIQQVNEILCMVGQTRAGAMVNEDAYLAQINTSRCEQGSNTDDDSNQSSGGAPELEIWTVLSQRGSNTAAQSVDVWVPGDDPDTTIFVNASVERAPSANNPFGIFSMNFASAANAAALADPLFLGTLATTPASGSDAGFTFYQEFSEDQGSFAFEEVVQVNVTMNADQTEGFGRVLRDFQVTAGGGAGGPSDEQEDFTVAFNETHLLRQLGSETPICLSRENFDTKVWQYNLYHTDGAEIGNHVERNSGFGFKTENDDYGWMGYYGMWVPEDVTIADGDTVFEEVWGVDEPTEYTIFQAPGRLIRFSREALPLEDIAGQVFEWWAWDDETQEGAQYQIAFDGTVWTKTAVFTESDSGYEWEAIDPPVALAFEQGEWVGMWSQGLGGHVDYIHGDACECVTVYSEAIVTPEDDLFLDGTEVTFYGYFDMLQTDVSQENADAGLVYLEESLSVEMPYSFSMDTEDMTLRDDEGDAVGFATGVNPESGQFSWGVRSGPMLLDTSGLSDVFGVFEEDVYYVYETGPNDWNRYTAAVDAEGDFVVFDPPLQFAYTHTEANDRNGDSTYDGQTFFLNYEGLGNLWGIPHEGFDTDGDGFEDRWYPLFSIADGVDVGPTGTEYVVKAIEMEQTLAAAPGECDALSLTDAAALVLPDASSFTTPNIGDPPVVTDPPAVVNGEVQTTN